MNMSLNHDRKESVIAGVVGLILAVMFAGTPCAGQTQEEITNDWKMLLRMVKPHAPNLKINLLPKDLYPQVVALAKAWDSFKALEITNEELDENLAHYGQHSQDFTPKKIEAIKADMRREKFEKSKYGEAVKELRNAAGGSLYEMLLANGTVDPTSPATMVFIPIPCPSAKIYERAMKFIDDACKIAEENRLKVVIVSSRYGREPVFNKDFQEESAVFEKRYEKFIQSGTVKMVASLPGETGTPWGFLFRPGELIMDACLDEWGQFPGPALKEFRADP
jgi:hypothetical protein